MNNKHLIGKRVSTLETYSAIGPITGVALVVDEENEYRAGTDEGYVMEIQCPYGTQVMANNLLTSLSGNTYYGFRADAAELAPEAELGDGISVGDFESMLAYRSVGFGPGHLSEIAAPGENELEHEYPYVSQSEKRIERKIAAAPSTISKTLDSITLETLGADGTVASVKLSAAGTIDLTGYATFAGLSGGTTIINGSCIKTGTIAAKHLNLTESITWGDLAFDVTNAINSAANPGYIQWSYIDKAEIRSPTIKGNEIMVYGTFQTLNANGIATGYMGAAKGLAPNGTETEGVVLSHKWDPNTYKAGSSTDALNNYVIVTEGGVRLQAGKNRITVTNQGIYLTTEKGTAEYNGAVIGSGGSGDVPVVPKWG